MSKIRPSDFDIPADVFIAIIRDPDAFEASCKRWVDARYEALKAREGADLLLAKATETEKRASEMQASASLRDAEITKRERKLSEDIAKFNCDIRDQKNRIDAETADLTIREGDLSRMLADLDAENERVSKERDRLMALERDLKKKNRDLEEDRERFAREKAEYSDRVAKIDSLIKKFK